MEDAVNKEQEKKWWTKCGKRKRKTEKIKKRSKNKTMKKNRKKGGIIGS